MAWWDAVVTSLIAPTLTPIVIPAVVSVIAPMLIPIAMLAIVSVIATVVVPLVLAIVAPVATATMPALVLPGICLRDAWGDECQGEEPREQLQACHWLCPFLFQLLYER